MYHINVNKTSTFDINVDNNNISINNDDRDFSIVKVSENTYHVLTDNKSYNVELLSLDTSTKMAVLKVNGNKYECEIKDQFDDLLKSLGLDNLNNVKVNDIKAPMPGLVLKTLIEEGQEFKKGDNLLVLEAMKMENILKAPADGVAKKIKVKAGDKVEKNEVLILLA
jgi:biotin carboxyl carrier protein